jgi:hypothetical protein
MATTALLTSLAAAIAATGPAAPADEARAACIFSVTFRGASYEALAPGEPVRGVRSGPVLRGAAIPPCHDTGPPRPGEEPERAMPIAAREIRGVHPAVAFLARPGSFRDVVIAQGFFVSLPGHPLHAAVLSSNWSLPPGARCGGVFGISGTVEATQFGGSLTVALRGSSGPSSRRVRVRPSTEVRGRRRLGLPFARAGASVQARVRRCRAPEWATELVADALYLG